jgi:hypothetical protein
VTQSAPHDATDRGLMWRVAACWARDRPQAGSGSRLLDSVLAEFQPVNEVELLNVATRRALPFDLGNELGWIIGRPLPRTKSPAVPVSTIQIDGDDQVVTRCCVRTAVLRERSDGTIEAQGWRFELAEADDEAAHPYQHSQPIIGWSTTGRCLIHPPAICSVGCNGVDLTGDQALDDERSAVIDRLDQSQPAFPLATSTLTGLVASVIGSLYGASAARLLLDNDARLGRATGRIADDLQILLG